ncbi:hypothetical protein [Gordonia sp. ABSL49_1]|uniref:hypothetical protein n=1 Tax=Gordonia sp. ABSL49_1 TaxID=2920941 RepID=UPI001F0D5E66|nr:hypothetical protein [Gordonia sp. ABSL49_1]MCH5644149.1 hypothetical protein [Gordonia sp. ABSL49_1]
MTRAKQAEELGPWGLTRRVPDQGSVLAADDEALFELLPDLEDPYLVSGTAVFPAMAATDNASCIVSLLPHVSDSERLHAPAAMNLCRTSMESAARTIWLLSPLDRETRRQRTTSLAGKEWHEQGAYFAHAENVHRGRLTADEEAQRAEHAAQSKRFRDVAEAATTIGFDRPTRAIEIAGAWIDDHPPAHAREEVTKFGVKHLAQQTYCITSSTVHGYKWVHEHVGSDGRGLFNGIADALAMALLMTETAVALFEALSFGDEPSDYPRPDYPARLEPTIEAWADMYR